MDELILMCNLITCRLSTFFLFWGGGGGVAEAASWVFTAGFAWQAVGLVVSSYLCRVDHDQNETKKPLCIQWTCRSIVLLWRVVYFLLCWMICYYCFIQCSRFILFLFCCFLSADIIKCQVLLIESFFFQTWWKHVSKWVKLMFASKMSKMRFSFSFFFSFFFYFFFRAVSHTKKKNGNWKKHR